MSRPGLALLAAAFAAACGDPPSGPAGPPPEEWHSEPDYRIGDAVRGDALFGIVPYLRVNPRDGRVFVLEAYDNRLSVWTPAGERLFSVGRSGEGPGDFMMPYRVHFEDSRFYVRDQSKFTYFSYSGTLLETVPNPPTSLGYQGFPRKIDALTEDGSFLGRTNMGPTMELGLLGDDPIDSLPVFSVREATEGWVRDAVYWRDIRRNTNFALRYGRWLTFPGQPFPVADDYRLDPGAGTVLVSRFAGKHLGAGEAELIELSAVADGVRSVGDTVWRRRLAFEPIRLTPARVEAAIDRILERNVHVDEGEDTVAVRESARGNIERSIHVPEYLPAIKRLFTASSGQVWLLSHETVDSLNVWYSVERGDDQLPPRRVLLPDWFVLLDATDTHVWGVWRDELDINYVVGRRLVPRSRGAPARTRQLPADSLTPSTRRVTINVLGARAALSTD